MKRVKLRMKQYYKRIGAIISCIIMVLFVGLLIECGIANRKIENLNADNQFVYQRLSECESELEIAKDNLNEYQHYKDEFILEQEKNTSLQTDLDEALKTINSLEETIDVLKSDEYKLVYIGDFTITYYCNEMVDHICGGSGITASGKPTEVGWTAAADTSVLPMGSIVYIQDIGFREIMDVGGAVDDNHIDVLVQEHQEAIELGTHYSGIWLLVKQS